MIDQISSKNSQDNQSIDSSAIDSETVTGDFNFKEIRRTIIRKKKLVIVVGSLVGFISVVNAAYNRIYNPIYKGEFTLLITDPIRAQKDPATGSESAELQNLASVVKLTRNTTDNDVPTLLALLKSHLVLKDIAAKYGTTPKLLAKSIDIFTGTLFKRTVPGVLEISVFANSTDKVASIMDDLSNKYLGLANDQRRKKLREGLIFLSNEIPKLEQTLALKQQELAKFREKYKFYDPTKTIVEIENDITTFNKSIEQYDETRKRLFKLAEDVKSGQYSVEKYQESISSIGTNDLSQGISLTDTDPTLLKQLLTVELKLNEAKSIYTPDSSIVIALQNRLNELKPLYIEKQLKVIESALISNSDKKKVSLNLLASQTKRFDDMPLRIKEYEGYVDEVKIATENKNAVLRAKEKFLLELAQQTLPWSMISPPTVDPIPVEPGFKTEAAKGIFLSLLAGCSVALLRDRLEHVFKTPKDVKETFDLPMLGHIPFVDSFFGLRENNRLLLKDKDIFDTDESTDLDEKAMQQRFFYQEAFRNLFTSIRFLNSDTKLKTIVLTSSVPAEGKSLTNILLAKTLSEVDQKVLLIDADMRKSTIHSRLGLNNLYGLSNLLTEGKKDWREAVQKVPEFENWSVMPAGRQPPDPTRLLSSNRMKDLLRKMEDSGEYDLILIDTPPIFGLADAALVAEQTDGLILLVSVNGVDRSLPVEAISRVRATGAPILGIVTNSLKPEPTSSGTESDSFGAYNNYLVYSYYSDEKQSEDQKPNYKNLDIIKKIESYPFVIKTKSKIKPYIIKATEKSKKFLQWLES